MGTCMQTFASTHCNNIQRDLVFLSFPSSTHTHSVFLKSTHRHVSFGQFIAEECAHFRQLLWC